MKVVLCASFLLQALAILHCTFAVDVGDTIDFDATGTKSSQATPTHGGAEDLTTSHKSTGISRSLSDKDYATVACVGNKCGAKKETVLKTAIYGVSCCAENPFLETAVKKDQCSVYAASRVLYKAKVGKWKCNKFATYEEATKKCAGLGARLCTEKELLDKCALGTGCGYSNKNMMVWSGPEPETSSPSSSPTSICAFGEALVLAEIFTQWYSQGLSWELINFSTNEVVESRNKGFYNGYNTKYVEEICVSTESCYQFHIHTDAGYYAYIGIDFVLSYDNIVVHRGNGNDGDAHHSHDVKPMESNKPEIGRDHNYGYDDNYYNDNYYNDNYYNDNYYNDNYYNDDRYVDDYDDDDYYNGYEETSTIMNGDKCSSSSPSVSLQPSSSPTERPSLSPSMSLRPSSSPTSFCTSDETLIYIEIKTDYNPRQIYWDLIDFSTNEIVKTKWVHSYANSLSDYTESTCVSIDSCYQVIMRDSGGDGIGYPGHYKIYHDSILVKEGGSFFETEEDDDGDDYHYGDDGYGGDDYYGDDYYGDDYYYDDYNSHPEHSFEVSPVINGDACPSSSPSVSSQPSVELCPPGQESLKLELKVDQYYNETAWTLKDFGTDTIIDEVDYGEAYDEPHETEEHFFCVPRDACIQFTIRDSYGDGICCVNGKGYYKFWKNGIVIEKGGRFNDVESKFILEPPGGCVP